jgi:hypothetical protein
LFKALHCLKLRIVQSSALFKAPHCSKLRIIAKNIMSFLSGRTVTNYHKVAGRETGLFHEEKLNQANP